MVCLVDRRYGRVWRRSVPSTVHFIFIAKERIAMPLLGTTRLRRGRVSRWLAGATALSLCALAVAYWPPQTASAAGPSGGVAPPIPGGGRPYYLPAGTCDRPEPGTTSAISPSDSPSRRTAGARRAATKVGATAGLSRPCGGSTERAPSRTRG